MEIGIRSDHLEIDQDRERPDFRLSRNVGACIRGIGLCNRS